MLQNKHFQPFVILNHCYLVSLKTQFSCYRNCHLKYEANSTKFQTIGSEYRQIFKVSEHLNQTFLLDENQHVAFDSHDFI